MGPILSGMAKPVHLLQRGAEVEDIVNIATIAVVDAQDVCAPEVLRMPRSASDSFKRIVRLAKSAPWEGAFSQQPGANPTSQLHVICVTAVHSSRETKLGHGSHPKADLGHVSSDLTKEFEQLGSRVSIPAGERLITQGEHGKGIYLLHSGALRMMVSPAPGREIMLKTFGPGTFIGLSVTLSSELYCYTVEATEESAATDIPAAAAFLNSCWTRPEACLQLIQVLGQEMHWLCNKLAISEEQHS